MSMSTSSSPSPSKRDVKTSCDEADDGSRTSTSDSSDTDSDSEYHDTFNIDVDVDDSVISISNEMLHLDLDLVATQTELERQMTTRRTSNGNGSADLLIKELTDKNEGSSSSCEYYDSFDFQVDDNDNVASKVTGALQPPVGIGNLARVNVSVMDQDQHVEQGTANDVNFLGEENGKDDSATAHTHTRQETKLVEDVNLIRIAKNCDVNRVAPAPVSSTISSDDENEFALANANSSPSHMDGIIDPSFNDVQGNPTVRSKHSKSSSFQCFRNIEDISRFVNSIISGIDTDDDDSEEEEDTNQRFPSCLSQKDSCQSLQFLGSRSRRPSGLETEGKASRSSHSYSSRSRSQNSPAAAAGKSLESNCGRDAVPVHSSSSNFYSEPTGEFVDMGTVPNFDAYNQRQGQQRERERNRQNGSSTVKGSPLLSSYCTNDDVLNIHGTEHDENVFSVFCNLIGAAFHRQTENLIADEIPLKMDSLLREIPISGPMLQLSSVVPVDWFPTVVLTTADKAKAEKFLVIKKNASAAETEVQVLIENEKVLKNSEVTSTNPTAPIAIGVEQRAGISSSTALEYRKTRTTTGCISVGKINSVRKPIQTPIQKRPPAPRVKKDVSYYMSNKNIVTKEVVRQNLEEWNISVSERKIEELHEYLNTRLEKLLDELTENSGRPNGMFTYKHLEAALKREGLLPSELGKNGLLIVFADTLLNSDYNKVKGVLIPKDGEKDTYEF